MTSVTRGQVPVTQRHNRTRNINVINNMANDIEKTIKETLLKYNYDLTFPVFA